MTENTPETVEPDELAAHVDPGPEWNPLEELEPVTHTLKVSGGRASVTAKRWAGRERLAYEDALTERMMTVDEAGEETVKIGTLRLHAMTLTLTGSSGFPDREGGRVFLTGTRAQREADLLSITDPDTFAEIREFALEVQPLPTVGKSTAAAAADDDEADAEDPSPTPRTAQTPTAGADA